MRSNGEPVTIARRDAFTLIELLAVLAILGVVLFMMVPALDGLTPRKRLESSARRIASTMDLAQGGAIGEGKDYALVYNLEKNSISLRTPAQATPTAPDPAKPPPFNDIEHGLPTPPPPKPEEGPAAGDGFVDEMTPDFLPEDVEIAYVSLRDKSDQTSGEVWVRFSRLGDDGSHIVALKLKGPDGQKEEGQLWVKYNALTRTFELGEKKLIWDKVGD